MVKIGQIPSSAIVTPHWRLRRSLTGTFGARGSPSHHTSLEILAMLADRAVAAENNVDKAKPRVAEIHVSKRGKLVGLLEDLSRRLKKLETATAKATQNN